MPNVTHLPHSHTQRADNRSAEQSRLSRLQNKYSALLRDQRDTGGGGGGEGNRRRGSRNLWGGVAAGATVVAIGALTLAYLREDDGCQMHTVRKVAGGQEEITETRTCHLPVDHHLLVP